MDSAVKATRRRNMLLIALALVVAAAGIGAWVYYDKARGGQAAAQPQAKPGKGRGAKGGDGGPVPVVAGVAQVGEIPIYLSGRARWCRCARSSCAAAWTGSSSASTSPKDST